MPTAVETELGKNAAIEPWLFGLPFKIFDDIPGSQNETSDTYFVYGLNDPLENSRTENSQHSLRALTAAAARKFQKGYRGYNPDTAKVGLVINPNDGKNYPIPYWQNRRSTDDQSYDSAIYFGAFSPGAVPGEYGTHQGPSQRVFAGRADAGVEFQEDCFVYAEKIVLTAGPAASLTGTCTYNGFVPTDWDYNALDIWALSGSDTTAQAVAYRIPAGAGMLSAAGVVTIPAADIAALPDAIGTPTHAWVVKVGTGTGTSMTGGAQIPTESWWA